MSLPESHNRSLTSAPLSLLVALCVLAAVALAVAVIAGAGLPKTGPAAGEDAPAANGSPSANQTPSEAAYVESVPEPGDKYYEAAAKDGSWVSYVNPRDEYRSPYLGEGSGKLCVTLLNEDGDVIAGDTVPNTTVEVPTGEAIEWHSRADPLTVAFPLTTHYERPLDADQYGTAADLPQGDGRLDAHCIEFHGLRANASISYGEATVRGDHADAVDVVGYHQQAHDAWETDTDPLAAARSHDATGGWSYETNGSHGQAVVVLQLNRSAAAGDAGNLGATDDTNGGDSGEDGNKTDYETNGSVSFGGPMSIVSLSVLFAISLVATYVGYRLD